MALLKPFDVMDGGGSAGFDAAVIAIDAVVLADGGVLEVIGFLFVYEKLDVVAQRALITFQGEDIVGLLFDHLGAGAYSARALLHS